MTRETVAEVVSIGLQITVTLAVVMAVVLLARALKRRDRVRALQVTGGLAIFVGAGVNAFSDHLPLGSNAILFTSGSLLALGLTLIVIGAKRSEPCADENVAG